MEAEWLRQGIERGIEQGIASQRAMLCRQADRKFGSDTAAELAQLLARVSDAERLERVGDAIIDCESADALIAAAGL